MSYDQPFEYLRVSYYNFVDSPGDPDVPGQYTVTADWTVVSWGYTTRQISIITDKYSYNNNYYEDPVPPPADFTWPLDEFVDEYIAPTQPNAPGYRPGFEGRLLRVYFDGNSDVRYVEVNVLKIVEPVTVVKALPDGTEGRADIFVVSVHNTPITTFFKGEWTRISPNGNSDSGSGTWMDNYNFNEDNPPINKARYRFTDLREGDYTFTLIVSDEQTPLTGSFKIEKESPSTNLCQLAFGTITPQAPALGQATGTLEVSVTGGWGEIQVTLSQGGNDLSSVRFAQNVGSGTLTGLSSGLYALTAYVVGALPACLIGPENVVIPQPALKIGDQLTFLPWVQSKLAQAAIPATGSRPQVMLKADLQIVDGTTTTTLTLEPPVRAEIYGPGDVLGINQQAILGTTPTPNAIGFSPLLLASIEFKEEDLPWRFSSLKLVSGLTTTPLPWCFLLVLKQSEYSVRPLAGEPLPSITVHGLPYPDSAPAQQRFWAHVQVNASLGVVTSPPTQPTPPDISRFLESELPANPHLAYARLFCARRLEQNTVYQAFLLPAVEAGRLAGLGRSYNASDVMKSAIPATPPGSTDYDFPVYFQWRFTTGAEDDFETLVRQLQPANETTQTASPPRLSLTTEAKTYSLSMPSLLVDAQAPALPAPPLAVAQYLYARLHPVAPTARPVVTPPLYGRAYFSTPTIEAPTRHVAPSWRHRLNLDPRYRTLAALGAQVIQDNQEEYVRRAWEQVRLTAFSKGG